MKKTLSLLLVIFTLFLAACDGTDGRIRVNSSESGTDKTTAAAVQSTQPDITSQTRATANESVNALLFPTAPAGERYGISSVIQTIEDSVVAINVTGTATDYFWGTYPTEGSGSGVIITSDGYIVTNNHVITGGESITVFLNNGNSYSAALVGSDSKTDLALLKINANGLTAAPIGISSTLRVGDYAIAIGNPLGELQGTVTMGIISALDREVTVDGETMTMLQTDAAVSPGNSGGGLFDSNGTLIGIVTAKNTSSSVEGIGFVIPIDKAKHIISDLMTHGYVTGRPSLGFNVVDITSQYSARANGVEWIGVYIYEVLDGSYAKSAGLQYKDYIHSVDGEDITSSDRLTEIMNNAGVGGTMILEIWRGNQKLDIVLVIDEEKE